MNRNKAIQGVVLLTLSSFFLRGIGMAYRIVLSERIGTEGMGLYQLIMTVYMLFSMLACAGLSITISRLCAEHPAASRSVVAKSCLYALGLGVVLSVLLYSLSDFISLYLLDDARASLSLKWIAPSLPMMGISAVLRGYFLAKGDVTRPTIAQMTEQIVRIGLVLFLLYFFGVTDLSTACAVIMFGASAAELVSLVLYTAFYLRHKEQARDSFALSTILRGTLPIWLGALLQCVMQTAENLLIPTLLRFSGISASAALSQYGLLSGMVLPVLLFPAAFPAAVGTLLLPEIARQNALGRMERVRRLMVKTLSVTTYMSILFCALFILFGQELMQLIYKNEAAGGMLILLAPLLPLMYVENICDSLLKGLGKQFSTLIIETVDSAIRIGGVILLLPKLGMLGYIVVLYVSALLCAITRLRLLIKVTDMERGFLLQLLKDPIYMLSDAIKKRSLG